MPLSSRLPLPLTAALVLSTGFLAAEPEKTESQQILNSYLAATRSQKDRLKGSVAEVRIDAEIPRLHKRGRLAALRHISRVGRVTYDILGFDGDNTVRNNVIARYLSAEVQTRESGDASMAVTPENYKFGYKGVSQHEGRRVHVFELKPRAKRKGLFQGVLWIDAELSLPVREAGRLVKNPSIFIKKVQFTRDYELQDGVSVVALLRTTVETRIAGPAHMIVRYADYRLEPAAAGLGSLPSDNQ